MPVIISQGDKLKSFISFNQQSKTLLLGCVLITTMLWSYSTKLYYYQVILTKNDWYLNYELTNFIAPATNAKKLADPVLY